MLQAILYGKKYLILSALFLCMVTVAKAEIRISTAAELKTALATVNPGEVLLLAPGNYDAPEIKPAANRPTGSLPITLRSADPANPAVFTGLTIKGASGLIFDSLRFDYTFSEADLEKTRMGLNWPIQILSTADITIRNSVFDGDLATMGGPDDIGFPTATALLVRHSTGLVIENNIFQTWQRALGVDNSKDIIIRGNNIHSIRMDGMNLAAVQSILIEKNHIHDFKRSIPSEDHADMIQFWTAGTKSPSRDVIIRHNILNSGNGAYTQSIFMRNEVVDQGKAGRDMLYNNVVIEENIIINAHLHGITVGEADGLTIKNNTLIHNARSDGEAANTGLWTPRINIHPASDNVEITDNITTAIDGPEKRPDWVVKGNLLIQDRDPMMAGWYDDVFVAARTGDPSTLGPFTYLPGGLVDKSSAGASGLWADRLLKAEKALDKGVDDTAVALIQVLQDPRYVNRFAVDASLSLLPETTGVTEYLWSFDGVEVAGPQASFDFVAPGPHQIGLAIKLPSGQTAKAKSMVDVPYPDVLGFDSETGVMLTQQRGRMLPLKDIPLSQDKTLLIGKNHAPLEINRAAIEPVFNAQDVALHLRLRTIKNPDPTGEILRIHKYMILLMTPTGGLEFQLFTEGASKPIVVKTAPLRLFDGDWHDIDITYDANAGKIILSVDGQQRAQARGQGRLGPAQSWGLSFGNPFGQKSFEGEIATFDLQSNVTSFAP